MNAALAIAAEDPLNYSRGRVAWDQRQYGHLTTIAFSYLGLRQLIEGIIPTFHIDVWLQYGHQSLGSRLIEDDYVVHKSQSRQNLRPFFLRQNRAVTPLDLSDRSIAV
jgi:hypothetical protein